MVELSPTILLAQHGLFVADHTSSIASATRRPYAIRLGGESDVDQLLHIEQVCWGTLQLSKERVLSRIRNHSAGQWVCTVDGLVVGVMYTQNLATPEVLLQEGVHFHNQEQLHVTEGARVVQLLGVAVLPEYAHLQIGSGLRNFVLQLAHLSAAITTVVAMTRCSSITDTSEKTDAAVLVEYNTKALAGADPTLTFHTSGGATIVATVPNYRPEDTLNLGHAVLIKYIIKPTSVEIEQPVSGHGQVASPTTLNLVTAAELRTLLLECLETPESVQAAESMSEEAFLDAPFMDLGLHSLAMVDMQTKLVAFLSAKSASDSPDKPKVSRTLLFDFPTPRALLSELDGSSALKREDPVSKSALSAALLAPGGPTQFAICAMSCRLPGDLNTPDAFHAALLGGADTVTAVPAEWGWDAKTRRASLLSETAAETFDAAFFKLNAAEAQHMDPHQRIILEVGHEALVSAQVLQQKDGGDRVGVFVGLCNNEWKQSSESELGPYHTTGSAQSATANRVSFLLGLTGPSMVVDTACSSSLAALHTAMNALRCGDCDVALVAAADLLVSAHSLKIREAANMLSPDGLNKSFDDAANGYVRGEGAGAIVLKTLARAEADLQASRQSAPILAVIRGSAMNQDGRSASFTAPNGSAQRALLRDALRVSGVSAGQLSYLEAHGTGTSLGDPIEWGAIRDILLADPASSAAAPLVIGALKSNMGHLEGAAGMAGLIKAVNCLRTRTVPANLHLQKLNSRMIVDETHRRADFPRAAVPLQAVGNAREVLAGVSSFGSGGTNVHVILQSYTSATPTEAAAESVPQTASKLAFLCAGQGLVYKHVGRELFEGEPAFKESVLRCSKALSLQPSLAEVMYTAPDCAQLIHTPVYSQLALYALEVALANVWKARGVTPDAVTGHSLGEYAAAAIAGVFSPEVGIKLVHLRLQSLIKMATSGPTGGLMAAVRCSEEAALSAIRTITAENADFAVALAGINGPNSVVLSGAEEAVQRVLSVLGNPSSKNLVVEYAFHSPLVQPAAQDFLKQFHAAIADGSVKFTAPLPNIQFISCLRGKVIDVSELTNPAYWVEQMLSPVRFLDCVRVLHSADVNARFMAEIGPSNMFVKQAALGLSASPGEACVFTSSLEKGTDALDQLNFAVSLAQRSLHSSSGARGGRLSPVYRPVLMKWRQMGRSDTFNAQRPLGSTPSGSFGQQSYLYDTVRAAVLSVLPPDAADYLSGETSFLSLGIDSLASQAVRNTLAAQLDLPALSNTVVLKHPSVDELVEFLHARIHAPALAASHSYSDDPSSAPAVVVEDTFDIDDLPEDGVEGQFPATCMQQAMLFYHISDPDAKSFIETFRWEVTGDLDVAKFHLAWVMVIRSQSSLRASFDPYAVPVALQRIWQADSIEGLDAPGGKSAWFKSVSLTHVEAAEAEKAVVKELRAQRAVTFDLAQPLLPRLTVASLPSGKHAVLLTLHHAVVDGFSVQILLRDLSRFYSAAVSGKPLVETESPSYYCFADFERQLVSSRDRSAQRFWSNTVQGWQSGPHAMVNMPALKINLHDEDVVRVARTLDGNYLLGLQSAARKANVTLAAFLHAAWGATYAKLTCSEDILYGNTSSGRSANIPEIGDIVGPVINTFPMRYTVEAGQSVGDYLHSVQRTLVNSLEFESYPLAEIQKLAPGGGKLFSVIFDFQTSAWDHVLSADSGDKKGVSMTQSRLLDRIGCPISIRVIVDKDVLQLHATSECKEYGHAVLESMLTSLVHVTNFMCDVVTGGNPLNRDVRARVFDLMDLVSLCRNRKLSIITFTEDGESAAVHGAGTATALPVTKSEDVDHVLPYISKVSAPAQFMFHLEGEKLHHFQENCTALGCEHTTVLLSFFLWAVRQYSQNPSVGLNFTSAHASNATKHVALNVETDISLEVLLTAVASALAVDQSALPVVSKSAIVFTCAANPVLSADTAAAMICHSTHAGVALNLKFPTHNIPVDVMKGIHSHVKTLLDTFTERSVHAGLYLTSLVPLVGPVDGVRPDCPVSDRLMHEDVLRNASEGDSVAEAAVVQFTPSGEKLTFSYSDIQRVADVCAVSLVAHIASAKAANPSATCVIAVVMEKGWEQVAAVLAVHRLQCAYLPMDARLWPEQRIRQVLDLSEAVAVLTQESLLSSASLGWMTTLSIPVVTIGTTNSVVSEAQLRALDVLKPVSADDLAYLIYTSGSTGIPKGVCCHHRGAMNTIDDLNSLFEVTQRDKVLALSSLSFDLSVYDIFGLLSAGGTVVIPNPNTVSPPDPSEWFDIVESEQVSIWNTVPAFMELLVSHAEYLGLKLPACLRLVYMSGDWIPVSLPNRIRAVSACADIRIISMGGATEASIWSNMFELENVGSSGGVPDGWSSIPYGRPMRNQRMYVLNERMENCDVWVTGAIYIGGVGVAQGYYKNPERTEFQFVTHKVTGEQLFRTGDLGRVRPGGLIEILGREDSQVKVNGFRIELGEIERVLVQHKDVTSAALAVHNNTLCAYLVMSSTFDKVADETAEDTAFELLQEACKLKLAEYMVPKHFMYIDEIPLSSNGKVQREKLPSPQQLLNEARKRSNSITDRLVLPATELESDVRAIFAQILSSNPDAICCKRSTFFDLGGNSLSSIQLIFGLRDKFGVTVGVQDLFRTPTVMGVAALIAMDEHYRDPSDPARHSEDATRTSESAVSKDNKVASIQQLQLNDGQLDSVPMILFNPAGASGLCYMQLVQQLDKRLPVYVLDDGVMTSGRDFLFQSIEHVAKTCLPFVQAIAQKHRRGDAVEIVLAGWSYGGVVASGVAKLLNEIHSDQAGGVTVNALILFDSPLRDPRLSSAQSSDSVHKTSHPKEIAPTIQSSDAPGSFDVQQRTQMHFGACTDLLRAFYLLERPAAPQIKCRVVDVRPEQTDYDCGPEAASALTSGEVRRATVPGTHWTMLFQDNAHIVAKTIQPYL